MPAAARSTEPLRPAHDEGDDALSRRPGWLYPKSPLKFGFWSRFDALVKLVLYVGGIIVVIAVGTALLGGWLETSEETEEASAPPTTMVDGASVRLMQPVPCEDETEDCDELAISIGNDPYVIKPDVQVAGSNVTDELFAAGDVVNFSEAFVVENVDPAVLLAGRSGESYVAVIGPSIEGTGVEPTVEQVYTICVSIADVFSYDRCVALAEPADTPEPDQPAPTVDSAEPSGPFPGD